MIRSITGFLPDGSDGWQAELICLHRHPIRHRPPFHQRAWVTSEQGRTEHLGTLIDCEECDDTRLPEGLDVVRSAGPFDETNLPDGLLRTHRVAESTWALLRVLAGSVRIRMDTEPVIDRTISAGENQPIPPTVTHQLILDGSVVVAVDFLIDPHTRAH